MYLYMKLFKKHFILFNKLLWSRDFRGKQHIELNDLH